MDPNYYTHFDNVIEENIITCDPFEIQGNIQEEEILQHQTLFYFDPTYVPSEIQGNIQEEDTTYVPSEIQGNIQEEDTTYVPFEIQGNIQSDDLEEEIQQCQISLDSIIQKGPIDTVIRLLENFYAEKLRINKVTNSIVKQCLTEYCKNENTYEPKEQEPELFIAISKSIGHTTYDNTYYINNGKKCNWNETATNSLELIVGKYEGLRNKLKTNRGNIKTGFWEYVCFMLSMHGHNNYTPPQCAVKYKNHRAKK
ncbi:unnamed protein product [Rhizophagus irregularis]|uniref:Uncharacterized protein n=1 Tax=Rhizophagus irregularis TaxID=588596 RepID=A0A2I1H230_9GLOM|nr:hypothetical protein RhiirA4_470808 [Rhizophagus irregularis]PKY54911.1 hypothetical protein RhiirA4_473990 [Rhizophagus irregularis]CAB4445238.1 unnamed protein product [Rhizophagus irregularis]CAB4445254.1 unnamed protein product [Rhizophagus irregularis]